MMIKAVAVLLFLAGCTTAMGLCTDVDTACTDGRRLIVFNTQFLKHATDGEVAAVVLHETAHIVLHHGKTRGDQRLKERAADQWTLSMLNPEIDLCRLARLLASRDRKERAGVLCEDLE